MKNEATLSVHDSQPVPQDPWAEQLRRAGVRNRRLGLGFPKKRACHRRRTGVRGIDSNANPCRALCSHRWTQTKNAITRLSKQFGEPPQYPRPLGDQTGSEVWGHRIPDPRPGSPQISDAEESKKGRTCHRITLPSTPLGDCAQPTEEQRTGVTWKARRLIDCQAKVRATTSPAPKTSSFR